MKTLTSLLIFIFIIGILSSCNTLYNTKLINIEVFEPGKVKIPNSYKSVAVRYNNCNISYNPAFGEIYENTVIKMDMQNTDSIASEIYYNFFVENISKQGFFDSVYIIEPQDYSNIELIDSLVKPLDNDLLFENDEIPSEITVSLMNSMLNKYLGERKNTSCKKVIDPKFGLYTEKEIQEIADSTGADLLLSLDFFATLDGKTFVKKQLKSAQTVFVFSYWNFYDLKKQKLEFFYDKTDTISWTVSSFNTLDNRGLPPRTDAIYNASDISGNRFAEFLIPHWIEVQRMYYQSGHADIKNTDKLVKEGKWKEAAKIWKANLNSPNKNIVAKCMYNLGVACEMEGQIEAAIDWVVKSYHIFGQKNEEHYFNCMDYIRILSIRKLDIKKINLQLGDEDI